MKILAVDTSTPNFSAAVMDGQRVLAEAGLNTGRTHSRHLMPVIERLFEWTALTAADLDALAVVRGPGSFTGLRIGISCLKGMAVAADKPLVGISSLAVLAHQAAIRPGWIGAVLDARKAEIYFALYHYDGHRIQPKGPATVASAEAVCRSDAVQQAMRDTSGCLLVGDGADKYGETFRRQLGDGVRIGPAGLNVIRAGEVGRFAQTQLPSGSGDDPAGVKPLYIRKSDAELNLGRRVAANV